MSIPIEEQLAVKKRWLLDQLDMIRSDGRRLYIQVPSNMSSLADVLAEAEAYIRDTKQEDGDDGTDGDVRPSGGGTEEEDRDWLSKQLERKFHKTDEAESFADQSDEWERDLGFAEGVGSGDAGGAEAP